MKKFLVLLSLILTFNQAQAAEAVLIGLGSYSSSGMTANTYMCSLTACKQAAQIIEDGQDYIFTGELTPFLAEKIQNIQLTNSDMSEEEAIDALMADAELVLK